MNTQKFVGFDALKQSVSMARILEHYGLLQRLYRSGDSLRGVCPLHSGHNPTQFRVNLTQNCWICFGDCHTGGSIVDFVSRKEGVGIREAGLLIQNWFGVLGSWNGSNRVATPEARHPNGCNRPLGFTLEPLNYEHPYLQERGLSRETIATFGLGLFEQGVLKGWMAIPIHNPQGKLVAYAARWPGEPAQGMPKYRFPTGFRKSIEVFNLHRATTIDSDQPLVVVEGFFGCMMVWQAGYRRVVSIMGSMLSRTQEEMIVSCVGAQGRVLLAFDEDEAGRKGRAEARSRLSRSVAVGVSKLGNEGMQPDRLPASELLELLR